MEVLSGSYATVETLVDANPETGVYIIQEDGHVYSWTKNAENAVDLGVYQAVSIEDGDVSLKKLSSALQNSYNYNCADLNFSTNYIRNKYLNTSLNEVDNTATSYYKIPVNYGETYFIDIYIRTPQIFPSGSLLYAFANANNVVIESFLTDTEQVRFTKTLYVPKGAAYLYINTATGENVNINGSYILKINNYSNKEKIGINSLDANLKNLFNEVYTDVSDSMSLFCDKGYFNNNAFIVQNDDYEIYELDVKPGDKLKLDVYEFYANSAVFLSTKDSIQTQKIDNVDYNYNQIVEVLDDENVYTGDTTLNITVPDYCYKIYINKAVNHNVVVKKVTEFEINNANDPFNPLNGKYIIFTGDSICYGAGERPEIENWEQTGWVRRIKEYNPLTNVKGFGVGGSTITKREGRTDSVLERLNTMLNNAADADYIIIQGGVNDAYANIPLGDITEGFKNEFDEYTFSGALESVFDFCTKNWLGKITGFIVTFKVPSASSLEGEKFYNYMQRAIEICKKWSIPYCDLFNNSNLNYYIDTVKNNYSKDNDGLHPNTAGYDIISPKINKWLKSI